MYKINFKIILKYTLSPILVLGLFSCSRLDVAIEFAPRVVANRVDDAFDLTSKRYTAIKNQIQKDLENNKPLLAQKIVSEINVILELSEKPDLSAEHFASEFKRIKELQKELIQVFKPSFSEVILGLNESEFSHMKKYSESKMNERKKTVEDKSKLKEKMLDNFEDFMDRLFDSTSKEQIKIYSEFIDKNRSYFEAQLSWRQGALLEFEKRLSDRNEFLNFAMKYYAAAPEIRTKEFALAQDEFFASSHKMQFEIWNSASENQKKYFKKYLSEIKSELQTLIVKK